MDTTWGLYVLGGAAAVLLARRLRTLAPLVGAKHPSLAGHSRLARRLAALVPFYSFGDAEFFASDGAPEPVAAGRRSGFARLAKSLSERSPRSIALGERLEGGVSDVAFTSAYRVPFQYRDHLRKHVRVASFVEESAGVKVKDSDGNWSYDLAGLVRRNVFGYDLYKECIERGAARVRDLGPVLGAYHPLIADNIRRLRRSRGSTKSRSTCPARKPSCKPCGSRNITRAARTPSSSAALSRLVGRRAARRRQPAAGPRRLYAGGRQPAHPRGAAHAQRHRVRARESAAGAAPEPRRGRRRDPRRRQPPRPFRPRGLRGMARQPARSLHGARDRSHLRRGFVGFRIARGGARSTSAWRRPRDLGKTLGGGLPVGVLCGRHEFMKRFRDDRPSDVCFARGTFNSHPYVMAAMNEFLQRIDAADLRAAYSGVEERWTRGAAALNARLAAAGLTGARREPRLDLDDPVHAARPLPLDAPVLPPR